MSHFLVMVIGNDPEKQLAPYHEFECTGQDDEYIQEIDQTEEAKEEFVAYKERKAKERKEKALAGDGGPEQEEEMSFAEYVEDYYGNKIVKFGKRPSKKKTHKYGYALTNEAGEIIKIVRRTNPNAKWDWYMLGGRYSGRLTLKEGAVGEHGEPSFMGPPPGIDRAAKGDIDLDTMRIDAAEEAGKDYDVFAKATEGHPWPEEWKVVLERYGTERIEEARAFYGEQPLVKAMRKCRDIYPLSSPEDYGQDRSAYIQRKVNKCGVPFAFIKDGKWHEKGEMGWFACVSNEKDENIWNEEFWKMFNALPDDTMISMYDCHI